MRKFALHKGGFTCNDKKFTVAVEIDGSETGLTEAILCREINPEYDALVSEMAERLNSARGWVVTHAMQTYSSVAEKEAQAIDEALNKYNAFMKGREG